ncbi:MAG: adenylate/guanylate cyclase domain-containing protein [Nitrospirota bacterium]
MQYYPGAMSAEFTPDIKAEIGHVLFVDIVGYSKLLINEQSELLEHLKEMVRGSEQVRAAEAEGKLIRLATGDGMALVFRNNPEAPANCALELSRADKKHPELQLRMGIHSGPINEITDLNERTNVTGAGINMAQRVMDCGDAGHILLSKRAADDLAEYRQWQQLLHEVGECEVKHGVRISVVNLYTDELGNPALPEKLRQAKEKERKAIAERSPTRSKPFLITVAVLICLVFGVAIIGVIFAPAAFKSFSRQRAAATASPTASISSALVPALPEKSIAVLPFENLSEEKQNAYFADGVQSEILTDLAKIEDLRVISRTSVMQYKSGALRNIREIGRQLGVSHLLEGSVQRSGNRVRITAQLVDARTDTQQWAEHYDRDLADVFAIQSEIAKTIADQLKAKISPQEKASVEEIPTRSTEAYTLYLRANQIERNADTLLEDYKAAEQLYRQAIALDANFALAHARLASVRAEIFHYYEPLDSLKDGARSEAEIALQLQPNLAEAHLALGQCAYWVDQDYERALKQFGVASRLSPNSSEVGRLIAAIKRRQGKWQESLEEYERVERIDPQNPNAIRELVFTNTAMRRWPEAAQWAERMRAMAPASLVAKIQSGYVDFWWRGDTHLLETLLSEVPAGTDPDGGVTACRWEVAMLRRAYSAARNVLQTSSVNELSYTNAGLTPKIFFEGCIYLAQGDNVNAQKAFELARPAFESSVKEAPASAHRHANLGLLYAFMGRKDDALREGRLAVELRPESSDAVDGPIMNCYLALIYARVGENNLAIPLIERLLKTPGAVDSVDYSITVNDLEYRWEWDAIRRDPRFEKIVASLAPTEEK